MDEYRANVGVVVFNKNRKVLMCARADQKDWAWQFPQGGIDDGEKLIEAAKRELREETGITSVEVVASIDRPILYRYPKAVREDFVHRGHSHIGQAQYWVLFRFDGDDSEIDFCTHPEEIEFKAYEWCDFSEAPKRIVAFKKDVYQQVYDTFKPYLEE